MLHKILHKVQRTAARIDDGTIHGGVRGGRNTMTTASSGIVAGVPSANVAMAMMDGTMTAGESEVVAQIATVTAAGTGVEIAISAMTGTVGVESRRIRVD